MSTSTHIYARTHGLTRAQSVSFSFHICISRIPYIIDIAISQTDTQTLSSDKKFIIRILFSYWVQFANNKKNSNREKVILLTVQSFKMIEKASFSFDSVKTNKECISEERIFIRNYL